MSAAPVQQDVSLESLVAQVADEFLARQKRGEQPDVEEYAARYPQFATAVREVLTALRVIGLSAASGSAPADGEPATGLLGDFRILREVGRGGMGVVYEAEQLSLGRRVALKVLPLAGALDPRHLQRFHNEARAAACLHHPSIAPVYAVGCERGVHYYAMQFIDGLTLAQFLDRQRQGREAAKPGEPTTASAPAPVPAAPSAETAPQARETEWAPRDAAYFRRVADWGIQAAEALEHAHQLGIVHRDIKPGNLMLDGPGKLWITDFGLARMGADTGLTLTGDLVGTLRYMSPEQALAKRVVIDHRTDIYSLGVTLYELLALRPVFDGNDRQELLRQIACEEPRPPRRWTKAIPAELETIVLKALEKNPAERYATAQELADDLRNFQEDRPIRARRPSLLNRLGRWRRRHKLLVTGIAVLVLTVFLLGGAGLWWLQRQWASTEQAVNEDLQEAEMWQKQERWSEALQALERAEGRLASGGPLYLRERIEQWRKNATMVARLEEAGLQRASAGPQGESGQEAFDNVGADQAYGQAFASYGLNLAVLGPEAAAERIRTSAIHAHLVAALDDWAFIKKQLRAGSEEPLRAVARLADDDAWRQQLRDPKVLRDRAALKRLAGPEGVLAQPPANLVLLSRALVEANEQAVAVRLLRQAQQRYPADFWINFELAQCLYLCREPETKAESLGFIRVAVALRPRSAVAYNNLGASLANQGNSVEAEAACRKAIDLKPGYGMAHYNLGFALYVRKDLAGAIASFKEALRLKNLPGTHIQLGIALKEKGDLEGAIQAYQEALRLKKDDPKAHNNLGTALQAQGDVKGAIECYTKALDFDPKHADAHYNLGNALAAQKDWQRAIACYRKVLELEPKYTLAHNNLGNVLQLQGDVKGAIACYQRALALDPKLAGAHHNLGVALQAQGDVKGAIACYTKALALDPKDALAHTDLRAALQAQGDVKGAIDCLKKALELDPKSALAHYNLGNALMDQKDWKGAIACYKQALALDPIYARAHTNLGAALDAQGDVKEAIACYKKALALDPKDALAHYNLGVALQAQGQVKEAIACYKKALQLEPKDAPAHTALGLALQAQGDVKGAIDCFQKALALDPKDALAHYNLGNALKAQGAFPEARAATQQALQLLPKGHPLHAGATRQLQECQRLLDLDARLTAIRAGDDQPKDSAEQLALADLCRRYKQRYAAAARFYADAFAASAAQTSKRAYDAACAAALAGCGQGKDAESLDDKERARLRQQARDWLQADLTAWRQRLVQEPDIRPVVLKTMRHWQQDKDFVGVRDPKALAQLPEAERHQWQKLWQEVETLRKSAADP
jgi:tetratricopeptide (TPR) repeat protein